RSYPARRAIRPVHFHRIPQDKGACCCRRHLPRQPSLSKAHQRGSVRGVGTTEVHYAQFLTFKRERIPLQNFGQYKIRRNLTRKTHIPERPYIIRLDLVLHAGDGGSSGKRPRVGEPVQQESLAKEQVSLRVRDEDT